MRVGENGDEGGGVRRKDKGKWQVETDRQTDTHTQRDRERKGEREGGRERVRKRKSDTYYLELLS